MYESCIWNIIWYHMPTYDILCQTMISYVDIWYYWVPKIHMKDCVRLLLGRSTGYWWSPIAQASISQAFRVRSCSSARAAHSVSDSPEPDHCYVPAGPPAAAAVLQAPCAVTATVHFWQCCWCHAGNGMHRECCSHQQFVGMECNRHHISSDFNVVPVWDLSSSCFWNLQDCVPGTGHFAWHHPDSCYLSCLLQKSSTSNLQHSNCNCCCNWCWCICYCYYQSFFNWNITLLLHMVGYNINLIELIQ